LDAVDHRLLPFRISNFIRFLFRTLNYDRVLWEQNNLLLFIWRDNRRTLPILIIHFWKGKSLNWQWVELWKEPQYCHLKNWSTQSISPRQWSRNIIEWRGRIVLLSRESSNTEEGHPIITRYADCPVDIGNDCPANPEWTQKK
jgi:hypothetical protein